MLQQHLPFTVLKLNNSDITIMQNEIVATALTVYGIETKGCFKPLQRVYSVATALTVYGIETF